MHDVHHVMSWVVDKKNQKNMFTHDEENRFLITDFFVFHHSPSGFYHGMGESTLGYHWFRQWVCRLLGSKTLIRPNHYNCLVETSEPNLTLINTNHFFQELHFEYYDDLQDILRFIQASIYWLLRPRQNGRHSADDIFKWFFLMKLFVFRLKYHLNLFPRVQLTIRHHWSR